jgi:hypothetical protein
MGKSTNTLSHQRGKETRGTISHKPSHPKTTAKEVLEKIGKISGKRKSHNIKRII